MLKFTKETLWEDDAPVWVNWTGVTVITPLGMGAVEVRFVNGPAIWIKGPSDELMQRVLG